MTDNANNSTPHLELPKESPISYILNGISNGAMVGAIPFLLVDLARGHVGATKSNKAIFTTAAGALIGAVYGFYEADRIHEYRTAVNKELSQLRNEVSSLRKQHPDKHTHHSEQVSGHSR